MATNSGFQRPSHPFEATAVVVVATIFDAVAAVERATGGFVGLTAGGMVGLMTGDIVGEDASAGGGSLAAAVATAGGFVGLTAGGMVGLVTGAIVGENASAGGGSLAAAVSTAGGAGFAARRSTVEVAACV